MKLADEIEIIKSFFKSKKILKLFLAVMVVVMLGWLWGYIRLLYSDEYKFAKSFLNKNTKVTESLGLIVDTRPGFTNFKTNYAAGVWTAKFQVIVNGNKQGVVYLHLTNSNNNWLIADATLTLEDGQLIDLKQ